MSTGFCMKGMNYRNLFLKPRLYCMLANLTINLKKSNTCYVKIVCHLKNESEDYPKYVSQ